MIWIYRLLFLPALLLALPYYGFRMWRRGGYGRDFKHRFGCLPSLPAPRPDRPRIWIQAVSVGEVLAIGPLIAALRGPGQEHFEIVLTTTTSTGYAEARKRYAATVEMIAVFPIDFWLCSRAAWRRLRPDAIILTESELWPEHLHQAQAVGASAFLVNARLSDRSFQRYQKIRPLAQRLFRKLDRIFPASNADAERIRALGATSDRIDEPGNLKFDVAPAPRLDESEIGRLRAELGFGGEDARILVGASTWPGEEDLMLRIQKNLRASGVDLRLLIVPRHAERGPEIAHRLASQALPWQRRSDIAEAAPAGDTCIYLADTTGELTRLMQAGHLVFIGKSIHPNRGGQTPIESAGLGLPTILGPNMQNFREVAAALVAAGAARQVPDAAALEAAVSELIVDPGARQGLAQNARHWHAQNIGASERTAAAISRSLSAQSRPAD